ncbi:Oidioi.mRNA.OKI2018_I69.chr1.g3186.t1.cds [Oikopleura dioica]|uniref:Oidioi.mRNA.OKI2018_I69.chr1.g3186.t1.cds n=1 Tax=Oikopleura dioica TaxID=34765 RepID=A0ABN7T2K3_OIKDI|nr:Oidioi.mRNA.OKI2018_I69.chr1.g3186.t1.cds [Oikopleura dioica]
MSGADICFEIIKRASDGYVFSEAVVSHYMNQILQAVRYCHNNDVIHRDLTPMCVLLQSREIKAPVKLGRFGLAIECKDGQTLQAGEVTTPHFMAPEMSLGEAYGKQVDMWSCGVMLHLLLSGMLPFVGSGSKLIQNIQKAHVPMNSPVWAGISESAKNLVTRLLTVDPQERITITEALQHPWIADRKRVCNSKNLNQTITNLSKFNARRRLKGAVSDAFASRLPPQQETVLPNSGVGEVLDSLDEIDAIGNNDPAGLDDPSLQKWLDIFDGISSLDLSSKKVSSPCAEQRFAEVYDYLKFLPPGDGPGPEFASLLLNPHFPKLLIAHDLISSQIYQQPNLSGTTCSAGSAEVANITNSAEHNQHQQPGGRSLKKISFNKGHDEPLGITLRMDQGKCLVARVIIGGMIHRQNLLNVGDEIFDINGISVRYKEIGDLQMMLRSLRGTITFTIQPSETVASPTCEIYVRALFDFDPMQSSDIPCKEAGLRFSTGEVLMISCKDDDFWWQARNMDTDNTGLVPSPQFREWKANSEHLLEQMRKKKGTTPTQGFNPVAQTPQNQTLCYEEVKKVQNFRRKCLVLIGAHGVGRRNIKNMLMSMNGMNKTQYSYPVPTTTRPPRPGEQHGQEYFFMNYSEMNLSIQKGEFLEYGEHEGQLYGTKLSTIRDIINNGQCAILDVEPTALRLLKNKVYAPLVVYVAPGNGGDRTMGYEGNPHIFEDSRAIMQQYSHAFDVIIPNNSTETTASKIYDLFEQLLQRPQWVPSPWV